MQVITRVERAWFQLLELSYDELFPSFAFDINVRPYFKPSQFLRTLLYETLPPGQGGC